jgi:hypothetical protein
MDNQNIQATPEKIAQAQDLLQKASLVSPATRLMCEAIIESKSILVIDELILHFQQLIAEKESAYQEFKHKISEVSKDLLAK